VAPGGLIICEVDPVGVCGGGWDSGTSVDIYIWGYRTDAEGVPPEPNVPEKVDGTLIVHVVESDGSAAGADIEASLTASP
jgi:hypothetical protein